MTNIEQKALALLNKVQGSAFASLTRDSSSIEALCRAIEQHEAFRQEVSDAIVIYSPENRNPALGRFIIPAPKPDPLVEIIGEIDDGTWGETKAEYADRIRAALDALGFEIREKNDD